MTKVDIPASPADVTQEHIDFIAQVAGLKKVIRKPHCTEIEFWQTPDGGLITRKHFNPFTKMEHCKLLDKFLIERELSVSVWYYYNKSEKYFYYSVYIQDKDAKIICHIGGFYPEEFARTCAILKAKLEVG